MANKYEESKLLEKINFKYRDIVKQLNIATRRKEELHSKLNNLNSDEKFTARDFRNYQDRYDEQMKFCNKLECEEKVWHDCREMLFDVIDNFIEESEE